MSRVDRLRSVIPGDTKNTRRGDAKTSADPLRFHLGLEQAGMSRGVLMDGRPTAASVHISPFTTTPAIECDGFLRFWSCHLRVHTTRRRELLDITGSLREFVSSCGVAVGTLQVFSLHTTCGVIINEKEEGFHEDLLSVFDSLASADRSWSHDDLTRRYENLEDEMRTNGDSHILSVLTSGTSLVIPIQDDDLALGRWQRVLLLELDGERDREIVLQILGVGGRSNGSGKLGSNGADRAQ